MSIEEQSDELITEVFDMLGFCPCGNPEEIVEDMYQYLRRVKMKHHLPQRYLIYAYLADAHGLTDHFGSVYGAWLTQKGEGILEKMENLRKRIAREGESCVL